MTQLEDSCRVKEGERVDLELKLTQVKENLKKSLAGGELGAPVESKPTNKVLTRPNKQFLELIVRQNCYILNRFTLQTQKTETQYIESYLPVNCASEIRKRPPSIYASTKGNVMQKAKVNISIHNIIQCNVSKDR